jgi:hypothetical protein
MIKLALVMCIRNEERFLPAFLAYHRTLGVDRAYVYLDRCTDRSRELLARHHWVVTINRDQGNAPAQLALHQMACANDALERARDEGMDWLMMLDADEFAWGGDALPGPCAWWQRWTGKRRSDLEARGHLVRLLERVAPETEMILLRTAEVVPELERSNKPFWTLHHVQVERVLQRPVLHPGEQQVRTLNRWLGHRLGKSIVRTSCDVQAFDSHRWTRRQDCKVPEAVPLRTEPRGWLLHYIVTSPGHWWRKYRQLSQEPSHWIRGEPVEFPKQAWKEAAMNMDEATARAYFLKWVAVPARRLRIAQRRGVVRRVTVVQDVLKISNFSGGVHEWL